MARVRKTCSTKPLERSGIVLNVAQAEAILRSKFGEPAKPPTDYVIGFKTLSGKVLAIHREATETRI